MDVQDSTEEAGEGEGLGQEEEEGGREQEEEEWLLAFWLLLATGRLNGLCLLTLMWLHHYEAIEVFTLLWLHLDEAIEVLPFYPIYSGRV